MAINRVRSQRGGLGCIVLIALFTTMCDGVNSRAIASISETQVLVVYNSPAAGATQLKDAYLAAHPGIPAANVVDLNSAVLVANPADLTYQQFVDHIRTPIRNYLSLAGAPTPQGIIAIVLIRPMPHRIKDSDFPNAGDNGTNSSNEANAGDASYASVDAELVLLWQTLETGEAGGTMDSRTDNMIVNPYHKSSAGIDACATCARTNIQTVKTFTNPFGFYWALGGSGATRLTPGDMYLVCRIDGTSQADALALIDRARNLRINKATSWIILDEYNVNGGANDLDDDGLGVPGDPFPAGDDYEETNALLTGAGWNVLYDGTFNFIDSAEMTDPIIAYASYGENHDIGSNGENPPGSATYINNFRFPRGAIFNTLESDNGRALNGLASVFGLEQVADFIAAGGTFGMGSVWEPFSFTTPDNEFLFVNFLVNGRTWAEAAYSSLPALSWSFIAVGDPLATAQVVNDPGTVMGDLNGDGSANGPDIEWFVSLLLEGSEPYYAAFPSLDPIVRGDFDGDLSVTLNDTSGFVSALTGS